MSLVKNEATFCQTVDVGGDGDRITIAAEGRAQIVYGDQQHVQTRLSCQRKRGQQQRSDGTETRHSEVRGSLLKKYSG